MPSSSNKENTTARPWPLPVPERLPNYALIPSAIISIVAAVFFTRELYLRAKNHQLNKIS